MKFDLKDMIKAGIHFGHRTSRWSPKMRPYIWGARDKIHLIDVSKTAFLLERAGNFLKECASRKRGSFLWVGTKKAAQDSIVAAAKHTNSPYVVHRWIGGTISNFDQVRKAITRYLHLQDVIKKPMDFYKKKEVAMMTKEVERLEKNVGGIVNLTFPPLALIVVDAKKEQAAVNEALRMKIPVVALVDTNTDPSGIDFVIPANDDSPKSILFVLKYLVECVAEGQKLAPSVVEQVEQEAKKLAKRPAKEVVVKADDSKVFEEHVLAAEEFEEDVDDAEGGSALSSKKVAPKKVVTKKPAAKLSVARSSSSSRSAMLEPLKKG